MSESSKNAGKAAGNAARGVAAFARSAARSARRTGRAAKLRIDIASEKDNIKRLYTEIGRLYYEAHRDDPEGFFVQPFQQLDASMEALEAMEAELASLKSERKPDAEDNAIDVEIEIAPSDEPEAAAGASQPVEEEAPAE